MGMLCLIALKCIQLFVPICGISSNFLAFKITLQMKFLHKEIPFKQYNLIT